MVSVYKSRKKQRNRTKKKKKVFRKRRKLNKKSKRRKLKKKKRTQKGGSVRRVNPLSPLRTIRVRDKWDGDLYGPWIGTPHFINWLSGGARQYGSTSIAVRFIDLGLFAPDYGRVHLYGTALPQQTHPAPVIDPWGAITAATDPRNPDNWGGPAGLPRGSRMWRTMAYFMYGKGVKKWISHQGCSSDRSFPAHFYHDPGGDVVSCQGNPYGGILDVGQQIPANTGINTPSQDQKINAANAAANTWYAVAMKYPAGRPAEPWGPGIAIDPSWRPLINETIEDMTAGRMETWLRMNKRGGFRNPDNSTVIHCLAGWGRTGTTLFFYILRRWFSHSLALPAKRYINDRFLGFGSSMHLYDMLRKTANLSLRWDDMHYDKGTAEGMLPGRVTDAIPIDQFPNAYLGATPPGRGADGDWEGGATGGRTSDLVHEVFKVINPVNYLDNGPSDLFISRINIIIVNIWIYLYLTGNPGSILETDRDAHWTYIWLYKKPSTHWTATGQRNHPFGIFQALSDPPGLEATSYEIDMYYILQQFDPTTLVPPFITKPQPPNPGLAAAPAPPANFNDPNMWFNDFGLDFQN